MQFQNQRHKDKAEKVAKGLIKSNLKQEEKQKKAQAKKKQVAKATRKRKAAESDEEGAEDSDKEAANWAEMAEDIIKQAEKRQQQIDVVLAEHVSSIKIPDYLPITRLATVEEKQSRSARGLLIQAALKEAEQHMDAVKKSKAAKSAAQHDRDAVSCPQVGLKAFAEDHAKKCEQKGLQSNVLKAKSKKGGGNSSKNKDDAEMATQEVMKLGKHLLK